MLLMTESATDGPAVESAIEDVDRYICETSLPSSNDAQLPSSSQTLRVRGVQRTVSSRIQPAAPEIATALLPNKF
jgi:hypothetical protein